MPPLFQYPQLSQHCNSTYEALSYVVEVILIGSGQSSSLTSPQQLSDDDVAYLWSLLEHQQTDLSQLNEFPLDAPDIEETLMLLARLQNYAALGGGRRKQTDLQKNLDPLYVFQYAPVYGTDP